MAPRSSLRHWTGCARTLNHGDSLTTGHLTTGIPAGSRVRAWSVGEPMPVRPGGQRHMRVGMCRQRPGVAAQVREERLGEILAEAVAYHDPEDRGVGQVGWERVGRHQPATL